MTVIILLVLLGAGFLLVLWKPAGREGSRISDIMAEVNEHLRTLLQVTLGRGTDRALKVFWSISVVPGAAIFFSLVQKIPFALTACAALLVTGLPYGLLRLKLQKLRINSSREGEILITELLNNYKICFFNMQQAIDETAKTIEDAPNSKRLLFNLSRGLNTAGGSRKINLLLKEFRLSINTSWGNILANNMYFALASGIEVTEALSDLAETIKSARKVDEYARRENNEGGLMLRYLAPMSYFLTVAGGIWYFGLTPEKFLYYQFGTEVGLTWFTISAVVYGAGLLLNGWLTKTKLDF